MEFREVLAKRRARRSFGERPVSEQEVFAVLDAARRAPSAGNAWGLGAEVLFGEAIERYWECTMSPERRARFRWQGLLRAPVLVVLWTDPERYVERYAEADKSSRLGNAQDEWSVPYWWVDAGMAAQNILLAATDHGLASLFFGIFQHQAELRELYGLVGTEEFVGTIALGWPPGEREPIGRSARRGRPEVNQFARMHH